MNKEYKAFLCKGLPKVNDKDRTVEFIINTSDTDRDGEILYPLGADLKHYESNPVVLWDHNMDLPPIGRTVKISRSRHGLKAMVQFATTDRAEEIYQLVKNGFLNTASVGYLTQSSIERGTAGWKEMTAKLATEGHPVNKTTQRILDKFELLEWSIVPVPSNPNALVRAFESKSLKLSEEMQKAFGLIKEEPLPEPEPEVAEENIDIEEEPEAVKVEEVELPEEPKLPKPIVIEIPQKKIINVVVYKEASTQPKSIEVLIVEEIQRRKGRV